MAATSRQTASFKLPVRARSKKNPADDFQIKMALIDRIADLQGIETVECSTATLPRQVDIYLKQDPAPRERKRQAPVLYCRLNCNSVMISGLDRRARHQVLSQGWGKPLSEQVQVSLPRDSEELDLVWKILQRAYNNLFVSLTTKPATQIASNWDWPRFSRTNLQ